MALSTRLVISSVFASLGVFSLLSAVQANPLQAPVDIRALKGNVKGTDACLYRLLNKEGEVVEQVGWSPIQILGWIDRNGVQIKQAVTQGNGAVVFTSPRPLGKEEVVSIICAHNITLEGTLRLDSVIPLRFTLDRGIIEHNLSATPEVALFQEDGEVRLAGWIQTLPKAGKRCTVTFSPFPFKAPSNYRALSEIVAVPICK
jgi:hypothetical protein